MANMSDTGVWQCLGGPNGPILATTTRGMARRLSLLSAWLERELWPLAGAITPASGTIAKPRPAIDCGRHDVCIAVLCLISLNLRLLTR
jgi:hypothetical protein